MIRSLPHRRLRELSGTYGPVMHLKLGEVTAIVVSSAEAAKEIMNTHDITFSSRPAILVNKLSYGGKSLVFAPYGEFWREMRKICVLELLNAKRVQSFRSMREEEVSSLVRSIAEDPVVNLTKRLNAITNDITMKAVIGDKCKDQTAYLSAINKSIEVAAGFDLPDFFPSSSLLNFLSVKRVKFERIHQKLDAILETILQEHKQRRLKAAGMGQPVVQDLFNVLLRVQEEGKLHVPDFTDVCVKAVLMEIFVAGTETASSTLDWTIAELVRNPRVMNKAQSEVRGVYKQKGKLKEDEVAQLSYMKLVIKEAMRLHVPAPLIPRECRKRCEVLGYEIPEKARVIVNAWAIARDPQCWGKDAEEFRPERFEGKTVDFKGMDFEFIPFGAGRRICPGISFATANMELVLANLLCYFDWKLHGNANPNDLDMEETFGATVRRRTDLFLHAIPSVLISN